MGGLQLGGVTYARTMLFTSIVLHAFTRVMVVRQLDNLSIWSNRALMWSYLGAVGLQIGGSVYPTARPVWCRHLGLARLGGDAPRGGGLIAGRYLYDALDTQVGATLGELGSPQHRISDG